METREAAMDGEPIFVCNVKEAFLMRLFSAAPVAGGSPPAGAVKVDLVKLLAPLPDDLATCEVIV